MNENFYALIDALDLTRDEVFQLVINGFESSFLSASEIKQYVGQVNAIRREA